jgi:hypothetical protein
MMAAIASAARSRAPALSQGGRTMIMARTWRRMQTLRASCPDRKLRGRFGMDEAAVILESHEPEQTRLRLPFRLVSGLAGRRAIASITATRSRVWGDRPNLGRGASFPQFASGSSRARGSPPFCHHITPYPSAAASTARE